MHGSNIHLMDKWYIYRYVKQILEKKVSDDTVNQLYICLFMYMSVWVSLCIV